MDHKDLFAPLHPEAFSIGMTNRYTHFDDDEPDDDDDGDMELRHPGMHDLDPHSFHAPLHPGSLHDHPNMLHPSYMHPADVSMGHAVRTKQDEAGYAPKRASHSLEERIRRQEVKKALTRLKDSLTFTERSVTKAKILDAAVREIDKLTQIQRTLTSAIQDYRAMNNQLMASLSANGKAVPQLLAMTNVPSTTTPAHPQPVNPASAPYAVMQPVAAQAPPVQMTNPQSLYAQPHGLVSHEPLLDESHTAGGRLHDMSGVPFDQPHDYLYPSWGDPGALSYYYNQGFYPHDPHDPHSLHPDGDDDDDDVDDPHGGHGLH